MNKFENPDFQVENLTIQDVITTSPCTDDCVQDWGAGEEEI